MEFLKPILGDELYAQVAEKMKDGKVKLADLATGEYVDKRKFDEVAAQLATAQQTITDRDTQLADLKKIGDPTELQTQIIELQKQNKAAKEAAEAQIAELRFDNALTSALSAANARNTVAVKALVDRGSLKLDEKGTILGLKEQLETIKADSPYLFTDAPSDKGGGEVKGAGAARSMNDILRGV